MTVEADFGHSLAEFRLHRRDGGDGSFLRTGLGVTAQRKDPLAFLRPEGLTGNSLPLFAGFALLLPSVFLVAPWTNLVHIQLFWCLSAS